MKSVKCPQCVAEGEKSRVCVGSSATTCVCGEEFYDADGRHHYHDPNTTTVHYRCARGHSWIETMAGSCWCGWEVREAA